MRSTTNNATTELVLRVMVNWNLWRLTEPLTCIIKKYLAAYTHFVFWNERAELERDPTQPLLFTEVRSLYGKFHAKDIWIYRSDTAWINRFFLDEIMKSNYDYKRGAITRPNI